MLHDSLNPKHMQKILSKKTVIFITSLALFMEALDSSILNTAIPSIAQHLAVNPINLKIALISYLLSLAIFIPISSWLADKYGAKHLFIFALLLFGISSFYCGFAQSIFQLSLARFIQGIGGALMLPTARLIMVRTIQKNEFITAMSYVVMLAAIGVMLGPPLGGFIVYYFSWPWIFWVNIPVCLVAIMIAYKQLGKNTRISVAPLDKLGFLLFGLSLAGFCFALSSFSESAIDDRYSLLIILLSSLLFGTYCWHSKNKTPGIINTQLFQIKTFRLSIIGNLVARFGFDGTSFLLPLLLQLGLNYSPLSSGLLIMPIALGVIIAKPWSNKIFKCLGYKVVLIVNTSLMAVCLSLFALINSESSIYFIAFLSSMYGILVSIQYTGMNSLGYADLRAEEYSSATSLMSTNQRLAQSFGVACSAFLVRLFSPDFVIQNILGIHIFHAAFLTMAGLTLFSIFVFAKLAKNDGEAMLMSSH